jgi:cytochrome P450
MEMSAAFNSGRCAVISCARAHHILVEQRASCIRAPSRDKLRLWLGKAILTSEGEHWQRQRRLMQPYYTPKGVTRFAGIMTDVAIQAGQRWLAQPSGSSPINLNAEMMRLTVSVISRSMFNEDISESAVAVEEALQTILSQSVQRMTAPVDLPLSIPTRRRRYQWAVRTLVAFVFDIIRRRRAQSDGDDLLWLLIQARDQETGAVMDDRQLRDEVLVTFFAGHETTAQLLTWCFYLLSQNREVEEKLHAELAQALGGRT